MPYGTPTDPVAGTVITVAYAVSNILDPIRWLRLLTGNADPPGSNYVVVSDSASGTTWRKVPADALAAGVAVANLGYTPVNKAGDTMTGSLVMANNVGYKCLDNTSVQRDMVKVTSDNVGELGNPNFSVNRLWSFSNDGLKARYVNGPGNNTDYTVWHAGNDGAGSALDADLLDGQHGSYYQARANHTGTQAPSTISPQGSGSGLDADLLDGRNAGNANGDVPISNGTVNTNLNADMVDGQHASAFAASGHNHDGTYMRASTGSYVGNGVTPRTISLSFTPKFVSITWVGGGGAFYLRGVVALVTTTANVHNAVATTSSITSTFPLLNDALTTNGFIVGGSVGGGPTNENGTTYHYVAVG